MDTVIPKITRAEVEKMIKSYLSKPGNSVGGSLHIVLEDGNLEARHIKYCVEYATERGDIDGVELGGALLRLTMSQRNHMYNHRWHAAPRRVRVETPKQRGTWTIDRSGE